MPTCGDCENFQPAGANAAANTGICRAFVDEDGLAKMADLYMDASECEKFTPLDRIRTRTSEFMSSDPNLRLAKGFDEK